ncbi:VCBS domain-containing protein [Pseudovibrio sp. JE062]|uniref:VCBS domain-containing protein n=1 Tax=Pseudovibrio sp. JE062 TaxID=439495 RepID=UPI000186BC46|nr:VCBS domain-containing protein [Pseudovibrio sp. JE062]EEA96924.1 rhizobiocin/RTX toxin [Pseudovibrio sp. JE062]
MPNTAPFSYPVQITSSENGIIAVRVFFQDLDLSDTHSLVLNADEMIGTAAVVSEDTFHYDPGTEFDYLAVGETATDTFSYSVTDAAGESSTSTVTITLTGQNDGPVAVAIAKQTDENTAIVVSPEFSDSDSSDSHTHSVDTSDTLGAVTINEDGTFSYNPNGKFDNLDAGETATDTFTYTVTDAAGESSTETVTITVHGQGQGQNTPPTTYPVAMTAHEDGRIVFRIIYQDPDLGDTHTYSVNTNELGGILSETGDGVFEYTPYPAFDYLSDGETGTDTFTYTVTDNHGGSHTSTVTLTIIGENDAPVASAVNVSTTESSSVVVSPVFLDPDANDTHSFTVETSSTSGTVIINDDGTFTYDPNGQFDSLNNGEVATDTFSYTVTDSSGESSTETVTVTVNGESEFAISPAKLVASDGATDDRFGNSVSVNDNGVVVVGAYADDDNGSASGSIYVYTPIDNGFYEETKLTTSDGDDVDFFGNTTAINNAGVIVASSFNDDDMGENSGSIYVFTPTEGGSYSEVKLTASDGLRKDTLGQRLDINDSGVILAGAFGNSSDRVYVFTPDGDGNYTETQLALSEDFYAHNRGLAINNDGVISVGGQGVVFIYVPDGDGNYTETQLKPPVADNFFGSQVAVQQDGTVVVGSYEATFIYKPDGNGNYALSKFDNDLNPLVSNSFDINSNGVIVRGDSSRVNVYVPDASGGYSKYELTAFDAPSDGQFGRSVSINNDGVVTVGALGALGNADGAGATYVFVPNEDGNYVGPDGTVYELSDTHVNIISYNEYHEVTGDALAAKLVAPDGATDDRFGNSVSVNDNGVVVVGAYADDDNGSASGSIYVYTPIDNGFYEETKLTTSDGDDVDFFGNTTAINNAGVIVASSFNDDDMGENSGSIYVFTPTEGGSYSEVKLTASDGLRKDTLGQRLDINDSGVILAGAFGNSSDRVYVFTPDGDGNYTETQLALSEDFYAHNRGLAINNDGVISVGGQGVVFIYVPDGDGNYTETQLKPPVADNFFGSQVAVQQDGTVVVGSYEATFIYKPDGNGNYALSKFDNDLNPLVSNSFDINSNGVIVRGDSSRVNVYVPDASGGYSKYELTAFDAPSDGQFGRSVSINNDGVVTVGALGALGNADGAGATYVFVPNEDGNYVGPDGTVYELSDTPPVIETFDSTPITINGSENAEVLKGGVDADIINGNDGDDVISGGSGDDQLSGGEGNDTFKFASGESGHDVITDFEAGAGSLDVIEFESSVFADFDAVMAFVEDSGSDAVITIDEDTSITLKGVNVADLHQDDFTFV